MKKNVFLLPVLFVGICFTLLTCTTDDILPAATLSLSNNTLSEVGGTVTLTASLNAAASQAVSIPLVFSGTATFGADYSVSASEIIINQGQSTGSIVFTGIPDGIIEGDETIIISLGSTSGVLVLSAVNLTITILDADIDSDGDGVPDSEDECPDLPGDPANAGCPFVGLIINEILFDPPQGITGDSNGDGVRNASNDEFLELFNSTPNPLDISGYRIFDDTAFSSGVPRHVFPAGTIVPSNSAVVVFGGGNPTGAFGGAIVQTASTGQLSQNRTGDTMTIQDAEGNFIDSYTIDPTLGNPGQSYTRNPDIYGAFAKHTEIPESNGAFFSPGTKLTGNSF